MSSRNTGLLAAALILLPAFARLVSSVSLSWLLASPLLVLLTILISPLLYLFISHHLDHKWSLRPESAARPWQDDYHSLRAIPTLNFLTPAAWSAHCTRHQWARSSSITNTQPVVPNSPKVSLAIDQLLQLIIRDFVAKWHTPLATASESPSLHDSAPEFPDAVEATIRHSLASLVALASKLDVATLAVRNILPRLTSHLDSYRKAEAALRGSSKSSELHTLGSDQLDLFLANHYEGGRLHHAVGDMSSLNTKHAEQAHLRHLVSRLLESILPDAELSSQAVIIVVRELVACTIMFPIIDMLSDPDFWNALLDQKAGAAIHEQKLVTKLREALDKQDPSQLQTGSTMSRSHPTSVPDFQARPANKSDHRSFDSFLKSIAQMNSMLEARRTKNDIALQIRKTKANLENLSDDAGDLKRQQLHIYLQRLEHAHGLVESKIAQLGSGKPAAAFTGKASAGADPNTSRAKLSDVLLNPSSLSFFMEFMDRRKRLILVQFWLIVQSFKNPLEEVGSDDEEDFDSKLSLAARAPSPSPAVVRTLREDIELFQHTYFSSPLIRVSPKYIASARQFLQNVQGDTATAVQVLQVRHAILRAQQQIYAEMEEDDWIAFKKSDLFLKAAQDLAPDADLAAGLASSVTSLAPPHNHTVLGLDDSGEQSPRSPRPTSPAERKVESQHAHLFGTESFPDSSSDAKSKGSLFGDRPANSRSKSSAMAGNLDILIGGRTHHLGPDGRAPLFRNDPLFDDVEEDGSDQAVSSSGSDYVQVEKIDAIQSALHTIMDEDLRDPSKSNSSDSLDKLQRRELEAGKRTLSKGKSPDFGKMDTSPSSIRTREAPTKAGLKKLADPDHSSASARQPLFEEADSVSEAEDEDGSYGQDGGTSSKPSPGSIRVAAPGDLNLDAEIRKMTEKLDKLQSQEEILDALIRKAELTGARAGEVRLLQKSRSAVRREARDLRWQRQQFEVQLSENTLIPGQTKVAINSTSIALDSEGKEYAVYLIEISLLREATGGDQPSRTQRDTGSVTSGWIVGRRYSEFWTLHQSLKERFAEVKALESEFPGKRLVGLVHAPFVDARKAALERYLQALVRLPVACESEELRVFLSQSPTGSSSAILASKAEENSKGDNGSKEGIAAAFSGRGLVKSLFRGMTGVAEGLDDLIGIGPSMLDVVAQRLSSQIQGRPGTLINGIPDIDLVSQAMNQSATAAELKEAAGAGTTYWTEPICDLFVELFELKEKNNWLRRQAIVILLQQLFGSTVERKVRDSVQAALSPEPVVGYITTLQNSLWPNGELKAPTPPRSPAEKDILRESANKKLSTLIPELAANFIGRENARRGTRRVFSALQNKRLNKHLVYSILEMLVNEILSH